jgi:hypothetical protein
MPITLNGDTGITTPGLINTGSTTLINLTTTGNTILGDQSTDTLNVANGNLVLNSSGNLGLGTASPAARLTIQSGGNLGLIIRQNTSANRFQLFVGDGSGGYAVDENYIASNNTTLHFMAGGTGTTEVMQLTSAGNLGLGVTPSANTLSKGFDLLGGAGLFGYSNNNYLTANAFYDGAFKYKANGFASYYAQGSGAHQWHTAASGTAGNAISFTQVMTLDASGVLTVPAGGVIQGLTVGRGAGAVSTNAAIGSGALAANTTGSYNTAVGTSAGAANTTGIQSTFVGGLAGAQNTTGSITAVGYAALYGNTTGTNNVAVGNNNGTGTPAPLQTNTTGSQNTAVGHGALGLNTTASYNTAIGYTALYNNTTGTENTAIGRVAGYTNSTGSYNAFLGHDSGYSATGSYNTFVGHLAGYSMTTGAKNTILGRYNGNQGGLDIRTASNYIVLSDGDGNPRYNIDNKGNLQNSTSVSNSLFRQVSRSGGNATETFTSTNMGMNDNVSALINVSIGGTSTFEAFGGALIYWYMPRGGSSVIHQTIVPAFKGSAVTTFSLSVSGNSLVVTKDTALAVSITVIGGGGTSSI